MKAPKKRNPLTLNPLMRKSHVHSKNKKAERLDGKRDLKKVLKKGDETER